MNAVTGELNPFDVNRYWLNIRTPFWRGIQLDLTASFDWTSLGRPHIMQSIYHPTAKVVPRRLDFYSRPRIAPAIAEDCYILAVFYLFPTADFSTEFVVVATTAYRVLETEITVR